MNHYKVTQKNLKSAIVAGQYVVQYKIGKFVEPVTKSGLLVFDNFEDARCFANKELGDKIFLCECEEEIPLPKQRVPLCKGGKLYEDGIVSTWSNSYKLGISWPDGTKCFKRVKLIEEIEYISIDDL